MKLMNDDLLLLHEYAERHSENAFAELVSRHIALVYSVALRQVRDPHLAEEITQAVFIILACKADSLNDKTILSGWLCRTARYASANALTIQHRRQKREQEAFMQSQIESQENVTAEMWNEISPLLDNAMEKLNRKDHDALVLRFFENKNFAEVGAALGASEDAAKMRVNRALEKLRKIFSKRGVSSTTAIIAGTISTNSVQAAPVSLAKTISAVAIAKGAAAGGSTLTLVKGALKIMAWTKVKTAIVASVVVLLAAGTTTVTVKEIKRHKKMYSWQIPEANFETFYNAQPQITIVPTKFPEITNNNWSCDGSRGAIGIAVSLKEIAQIAYQYNSLHTVVLADLPTNRFDFLAKLVPARQPHKNTPINENWSVELQKTIAKKFGVEGQIKMREADVLVLKSDKMGAQGFKISHKMLNGRAMIDGLGNIECFEQPISTLTGILERKFQIPIVDQTTLTNTYDYKLKWDELNRKQPNLDGFKQALFDQLGLELVPTNMPIEMLVVERAK